MPKTTVQLLFASANRAKVSEYEDAFSGSPIEIKSFFDFDERPHIHETGQNYSDNAWIKAREGSLFYGMPAFAEDSGLEVYALDGGPGVYSRRYSGNDYCSDEENNIKLLKALKDVPYDARGARFRAVICLSIPLKDDQFQDYFFEGECEGIILTEPRGVRGFGYDPLFFVPELNKTFAEVDIKTKSMYSHRQKVAKTLRRFVEESDLFEPIFEN